MFRFVGLTESTSIEDLKCEHHFPVDVDCDLTDMMFRYALLLLLVLCCAVSVFCLRSHYFSGSLYDLICAYSLHFFLLLLFRLVGVNFFRCFFSLHRVEFTLTGQFLAVMRTIWNLLMRVFCLCYFFSFCRCWCLAFLFSAHNLSFALPTYGIHTFRCQLCLNRRIVIGGVGMSSHPES